VWVRGGVGGWVGGWVGEWVGGWVNGRECVSVNLDQMTAICWFKLIQGEGR